MAAPRCTQPRIRSILGYVFVSFSWIMIIRGSELRVGGSQQVVCVATASVTLKSRCADRTVHTKLDYSRRVPDLEALRAIVMRLNTHTHTHTHTHSPRAM